MRGIIAVYFLSALVSVSAFAASASASKEDIQGLKSAMEDRLKDADSAKFKDVRIAANGTVCGQVNAKNSYGAFAGFTPFIALKLAAGKFAVVGISPEAAQVCADKGI